MMHRSYLRWLVGLAAATLLLMIAPVHGQDSFFKGKTMHIIVGGPPGGGFRYLRAHDRSHHAQAHSRQPDDHRRQYARSRNDDCRESRLQSRQAGWPYHRPLHRQSNHRPSPGQPGVEFDMRKFYYLGAPTADHFSCAFTKASGITSAEKWLALKRPAKMGAVGPGNLTDNTLRVLSAATDFPIQLISGYKGTAPIRLAMESGEIEGSCWGWDSIKSTWAKALETGDGVVVIQAAPKAHPDLPKVPLAINFGKNQDGKQLIDVVIHGGNIFERTFLLPPGVPKDRAELLKRAFARTMEDPEFLADANKAKLGVAPVSGDELERRVNGFFKLPEDLKKKLRRVLYD